MSISRAKQLFEHLLQKWRRWPLLETTLVHPSSAHALHSNVSHLSDHWHFWFSVIFSKFLLHDLKVFYFCHHVNFKASFVKQVLIYSRAKQLFEHLLQKWRRWPLLETTVVHPSSAHALPGNVSDLSDHR